MAEIPLPTPTQVTVPSTDIRNAVFAGAKLDEEVTGTGEFYTDRLGVKRLTNTGRNNQFEAAQLDRVNRFEQFLLSSGYVFLGDYEHGPFQFSARNQYIRYDNQYYRLNAATDVGFTTTGTDATSFANDVTHFVLMDGDTLRADLGSSGGLGLIGGTGITTPLIHGAAADGVSDDTAAILAAAEDAIASGKALFFPAGIYAGDTLTINESINIHVAEGAYLNFEVYVAGAQFEYSDSVRTTLSWTDCPAGTTSIAGDFSAFSTDKPVAVKLNSTDGGSATYKNEIGSDISAVSAADSSGITLATATRLAYLNPDVQSLSAAVQYAGDLTADDYYIPGDYTAYFSEDDVVRIENIDGTDGVNASAYYFETVKIKAIDSSGITLKKRLAYSHSNPWLVKTGYVGGVTITGGGYIKKLRLQYLSGVVVRNIRTSRVVSSFLYDFEMSDIRADGLYDASTFNNTFIFGESKIHSVIASGSSSTTDNASFKVMCSPGLTLSDISSHDANASGSQGNYGFYVDAAYTPYAGANRGMHVSNVKVEPSRSASVSRSIWLYGLREAVVSGISGGGAYIQGCVDSVFSDISIAKYYLQMQDLVRCSVRGRCNNALFSGGTDSDVDLVCTGLGKSGSNTNYACRIAAGTTNPETGEAQTTGSNNRFDVVSLSDSTDAITLYISNQSEILIGGKCRDKSTVALSTSIGGGVTSPRMEFNSLRGAFGTGSGWQKLRQFGGFELPSYLNGTMLLNGYYLWMGSDGVFRASTTKPTSDAPSGAIRIGPAA